MIAVKGQDLTAIITQMLVAFIQLRDIFATIDGAATPNSRPPVL